MKHCSPLSLSAGAGGLALLLFSLFPVSELSLGGPGSKAAVFVLLAALAALALWLLRRTGCSPDRLCALLLPVGLAFFLRAALLDYVADDYGIFLSQWVATFRDNGGFAAINLPIGNYNVPYLYFLAAISYLPVPDLYLIKLFSILFDVLLAWGGLRLARRFTGRDSIRPLVCFCALLLLPTVVLNGSLWGQCDALYGALTLHALADGLGGRPKASAALLGIAFSFKLQTVFILPLWAVLWMAGRTRFRDLLCFPLAYAATCVPALLLGKPLGDILGVYVGQTQDGAGALNYNCASIFSMVPYGTQIDEGFGALLGIAFSFKLQTVFILPLWAVLWMAGRTRFRDLLCFPLAYAATCVPALLLGKPLGDILGVYVGQTQDGAGALNYNCASIFSMVPYGTQIDEGFGARLGILAAFALVAALLILAFLFRDRLDDGALLLCGAVLTLGVPFFLPYMHDRYYFLADVLTLAWACIRPSGLPPAVLVQLASLSAYLTYLRMKYTLILTLGGRMFTMLLESLMVLAALILAISLLVRQLMSPSPCLPQGLGEKNKKSRKSG